MKRILLIFAALLLAVPDFAGVIAIHLTNSTSSNFKVASNTNGNCTACVICCCSVFCNGTTNDVDAHVKDAYITGNHYGNCGVSGEVKFVATVHNKQYQGHIRYDKPYVGSNEYDYAIDAPFRLVLNSTDGCFMHFEIQGGPDEVTNVVQLPTTGSRIITNYVVLKANGPDIPVGVGIQQLFNVRVEAPKTFSEQLSGKDFYDGSSGVYGGGGRVGSTTYTELPPAANGDRNFQLRVTGLPDDIPLTPLLDLTDNLPFSDPKPAPSLSQQPCGPGLSPPRYVAWLELGPDGRYSLLAGYQCGSASKASTGDGAGATAWERRGWVSNPTDWSNSRAVIFNKNTNAVIYSTFRATALRGVLKNSTLKTNSNAGMKTNVNAGLKTMPALNSKQLQRHQ